MLTGLIVFVSAIEVEHINHGGHSISGPAMYLADAVCYVTKRVDPLMDNFFHDEIFKLKSNALSQIVAAAFDYAIKLQAQGEKRKQSSARKESSVRKQSAIKRDTINHKFAELKSKYFSGFLAALLYFDHLWEVFDIADDNIDDDRFVPLM